MRRRILVVEDNRLERKMVVHVLNRFLTNSLEVDEAIDGRAAIQMLRNLSYDLVITDLIMPNKIEGIQLIRTIKTTYPSTYIIAISGSKPYYLYLAKKLGVEAVFTKPLNLEKFIETIRYLLNYSQKGKLSEVH